MAAMVILLARLDRGGVPAPHGEVLATVERVEGTGAFSTGGPIRRGEWIDTAVDARVALRLGDGTSVRVDRGSRARLLAPTVIDLASTWIRARIYG